MEGAWVGEGKDGQRREAVTVRGKKSEIERPGESGDGPPGRSLWVWGNSGWGKEVGVGRVSWQVVAWWGSGSLVGLAMSVVTGRGRLFKRSLKT